MRAVVLIVMGFWLALGAAHASERRVALVVGISKYQSAPELPNPSHDADAVAKLLKSAGFDVVSNERDLGLADMRRAIRQFSEVARDADIAVVYYAGHGIEVDGTNYLVPADAKLLSDYDVDDETVSLDRVIRALDSAKQLKLVILDACRANPFTRTMKRASATRAIGRGLARVEPTMSDTLVAFAAKAGAVASDGDGANSPFASALVKYIALPGLDLRLAFGRVRDDVLAATKNRQEPFVYGSLGGKTIALVPQTATAQDEALARRDYELAAQIGTRQAWNSFLQTHSTGLFANLARAQNEKISAVEDARVTASTAKADADALARAKEQELRHQLELQMSRQADEARRKAAEQAKQELDEAKQQVAIAAAQVEDARKLVEEARRKGAEDAQNQLDNDKPSEKLAALLPNTGAVPARSESRPAMDPADITRLLQAHLRRVGCNPGSAEGVWDENSKGALERFNLAAQAKLNVQVASLDALDFVRSKTTRVCPLVCSVGQKSENGQCTPISCDVGYRLSASGACERRPVAKANPTTEAPAKSSSAGAGRCFSFNGKSYCE